MKKLFWLLLLCALPCSGATIKLFTDYPISTPVSSDFMLFQRNGTYFSSAQSQFLPVWFTDPVFTGNGSINGAFNVGGTLTVGGAVITGVTYYGDGAGLSNVASQVYLKNLNDNGTNETFWDTVFNGTNVFQEIDAGTFYGTNFYTFITNAPFLNTDGDGKVTVGVELPATNVLLSAGANIVFTTNGSGGIQIAASGTATITTITNNTFVNTNTIISTSNAFFNNTYVTNLYSETITNNTFVNTNTFISTSNSFFNNLYSTNVYASTNFSTNMYFVSGKGNTLVVTNVSIEGVQTNQNIAASSAVITKADKVLTNAPNAHGVFTNSATGPPSWGLLQNTELLNSSLTIAGTANQVSVSGGGPVSLGGTATLSLPSPTLFPGKIAVTGITNTGETSMQGVETNTTMGTGLVHSDNNGKRTSSLLVNADITAGTIANASLANSSITIQGSAVSLGGTTLAAGSTPFFDLSSSTNLIYRYTTNAITALALTFGKAYTTNLSANITITAVNSQDVAAYETCIISVTNSSGTDWKVTLPNGVTGTPGSGTPPAFYCTNKLSCDIFVSHYGNQKTNAWKIDWAP